MHTAFFYILVNIMSIFNLKKWKRNRISRRPWPSSSWDPIIKKYFPAFLQLRSSTLKRAQSIVQILYAEKQFEGCAGLEINDEVRLTILSQAALLLLGEPSDYYREIRSILVYPDIYTAPVQRREYDSFIVTEGFESRQGEAWSFGNIVLAWDSVRRQARSFGDGTNVTLHEFSHHLDQKYGITDQMMSTEIKQQPDWIQILHSEYRRFVQSVQKQEPAPMDPYGAESPAEFFAVASENFFERPRWLYSHFPQLYKVLIRFYQIDPTTFFQN